MSADSTAPQPRVIVLCFDGTANQYDSTVRRLVIFFHSARADLRDHQNTNVVKFYALLDKCCPLEQIVYYQVRLAFASAIRVELSITSWTRLIRLAAWRRNLLQPRCSQSLADMARKDSRRGHCMVCRSYLSPDILVKINLLFRRRGTSTSTLWQDTSSSCRIIGLGIKSVSLVRGHHVPRFVEARGGGPK